MPIKLNRYVGIAAMAFIVLIGAYAAWYSFSRQSAIAHNAACDQAFAHPATTTAPDGTIVPLQTPCAYKVVPPALGNLMRGRFVFEGLPPRFTVATSTSLIDILLGRYSLQPASIGCDQSATTTDCSTLPKSSEPQPYVPADPVQPFAEWDSATDTPVSLSGFSFELPTGWHGAVYEKPYAGGVHAQVQPYLKNYGFTIDCPPDGKGLESATRLSTEERTFTIGTSTYSVAFEKWSAPGNAPWYFVWIRQVLSPDWSQVTCLVQGNAMPDIEEAMHSLYETLR